MVLHAPLVATELPLKSGFWQKWVARELGIGSCTGRSGNEE
jgi:hypothetical protein